MIGYRKRNITKRIATRLNENYVLNKTGTLVALELPKIDVLLYLIVI